MENIKSDALKAARALLDASAFYNFIDLCEVNDHIYLAPGEPGYDEAKAALDACAVDSDGYWAAKDANREQRP